MIEALLQAERLLIHGRVDEAEQIYRSATEQDPNNAIAVVGLARVALERDDDQRAYDLARSALAIDPHNAAALRLEARLGEVLAARAAATPTAPQREVGEPSPADHERPSERAFFTRNPSMADHQRMEQQRDAEPQAPQPQPALEAEPERRPGLLRRLLGRRA